MDNERETLNIREAFVNPCEAFSSTADHTHPQEIRTEGVKVILNKAVTNKDFDFYEFARCISLIICVRER